MFFKQSLIVWHICSVPYKYIKKITIINPEVKCIGLLKPLLKEDWGIGEDQQNSSQPFNTSVQVEMNFKDPAFSIIS